MPPKSLGPGEKSKGSKVSLPSNESNKTPKSTKHKTKKSSSENKDPSKKPEEFFVVEFVKNLQEQTLIKQKEGDEIKQNDQTKFHVDHLEEHDFNGVNIEELQKMQMQVNYLHLTLFLLIS